MRKLCGLLLFGGEEGVGGGLADKGVILWQEPARTFFFFFKLSLFMYILDTLPSFAFSLSQQHNPFHSTLK
jgi:hypothetical protein